MSKARVKVTVRKGKSGGGTLLARFPVAVEKNDNPNGERLYQTKAQVITHVRRGTRPKTSRPRGAN